MAIKNEIFPRITFTDADIIPFVGPSDGRERLPRTVDSAVRAIYPSPENPDAERAADDKVEHVCRGLKKIRIQEDQTKPYTVRRDRDPNAKLNWIEFSLGALALIVMAVAMGTVPAIATMMIVQANKIALVADYPLLGLVFGTTALAGIFASIAYRDKLTSDEARLVFDRRLLKTAIGAFILWLVTASLVAFPPMIGGTGAFLATPSSNEWMVPPGGTASSSYEPSSVLALPLWWLLVTTGLLDLVAAPTLHNFIHSRVAHRPIRFIIDNGEYDHLHVGLSAKAEVELAQANDDQKERRDAVESWKAALEMLQLAVLARFDELKAIAESAGNAAARAALEDVLRKQRPEENGPD